MTKLFFLIMSSNGAHFFEIGSIIVCDIVYGRSILSWTEVRHFSGLKRIRA